MCYFIRKRATWPPPVWCRLDRAADHQFLDLADRLVRVQTLRANVDAVHDRVAAEQAVRIFQVVQARAGGFVARVGDEAVGLQQAGRADELVRIPPERWARRRAAGAQDALVQAVELFAFGRRLQTFFFRRDRVVDQERLDRIVLLEELRHVDDQVADHRQTRQRTQDDRLG